MSKAEVVEKIKEICAGNQQFDFKEIKEEEHYYYDDFDLADFEVGQMIMRDGIVDDKSSSMTTLETHANGYSDSIRQYKRKGSNYDGKNDCSKLLKEEEISTKLLQLL